MSSFFISTHGRETSYVCAWKDIYNAHICGYHYCATADTLLAYGNLVQNPYVVPRIENPSRSLNKSA